MGRNEKGWCQWCIKENRPFYPYCSSNPLPVLGRFEVKVLLDKRTYEIAFYVIECDCTPLLGKRTARELGVLLLGFGRSIQSGLLPVLSLSSSHSTHTLPHAASTLQSSEHCKRPLPPAISEPGRLPSSPGFLQLPGSRVKVQISSLEPKNPHLKKQPLTNTTRTRQLVFEGQYETSSSYCSSTSSQCKTQT
jgi:hypothetical protein